MIWNASGIANIIREGGGGGGRPLQILCSQIELDGAVWRVAILELGSFSFADYTRIRSKYWQ